MGHARYIGRVGALAVTLGVGWAIATAAPGVASAEPSSAASSSDTSTSVSSAGAAKSGGSAESRTSARSTAGSRSERAEQRATRAEQHRAARESRRAERRAVKRSRTDDADQSTESAASVVTVATAPASSTAEAPAGPDPAAPLAASTLLSAAATLRDETERNTLRRNAAPTPAQAATLVADDTPNVLLIGVDGTNLRRILSNPLNASFFSVMQDGTTAASSIVGHTTISNPSWSSILTGVWGETTGVINNVFTPWTYDSWPTVFNQLETLNDAIETTTISDWDVIAGIAGAGSDPVDNNVYYTQLAGDTNWFKTDDLVGDATEAAIAAADPNVGNFVFSYFVGVDENGHMYGGASPEYAAAITNVDRNLAEILQAVSDWEGLTGEQWTILMVTDHGHQPQKGLGHGFQSPDETSTFVIADGPGFDSGAINLTYSIVDITPTVVTLFGGQPTADTDGVSLTEQNDSNVYPINDGDALRGALQDIIAKYGYPDLGTQLRLGLRTVATSVPYFVFGFANQLTIGLQDLIDQDIPVVSLLAKVIIVPVRLIGDLTYAGTNLVAQIVAKLTGVEGASIFPLWPPAPPSVTPAPEEPTPLLAGAVCGDAAGAGVVAGCVDPAVAV